MDANTPWPLDHDTLFWCVAYGQLLQKKSFSRQFNNEAGYLGGSSIEKKY